MHDAEAIMARLRRARSLPGLLAASFDAFETIRVLARGSEDIVPSLFAAFMTVADAAADGRQALTLAPSLPPVSPVTHARQRGRGPPPLPPRLPLSDRRDPGLLRRCDRSERPCHQQARRSSSGTRCPDVAAGDTAWATTTRPAHLPARRDARPQGFASSPADLRHIERGTWHEDAFVTRADPP